MMRVGWPQAEDAKKAIIAGLNMNNLVAVQKGVQKEIEPGNRVIEDGQKTFFQRAVIEENSTPGTSTISSLSATI